MNDKYFVAFLDVLGFKLMLEEEEDKIETYFNVYDLMHEYFSNIPLKQKIEFYSFSDSVVVLLQGDPDNLKEQFRHFNISLALLQYNIAHNNIWLRGGISYGKLYHKKPSGEFKSHRLWGKPLVEAYQLESKVAQYPRIILSSSLSEQIGFESSFEMLSYLNNSNDFDNWRGDLLFSMEGTGAISVDWAEYLFFQWGNYGEHSEDGAINTPRHFTDVFGLLVDNLSLDNKGALEKYKWVLDYLQKKVETHPNKYILNEYKDELFKLQKRYRDKLLSM